jgi:hypothetical protein
MILRKWEFLLLAIIFCVGIFLRVYHFSDWLHFEIDQTYDSNIVSTAVQSGPGNLTLLGPTAGGGRALRLGPAFYYMQYISAEIFGGDPAGQATQVLLLNILSLPLFYLFCRRYFSTFLSIGLSALFSFSLYSIMYSRFSWSPNVLPFLILFSFYALLRAVSQKEKYPTHWFLVSVALVTITSQIHFNAFFSIPTIAVIFTAIKRPRFNWKTWLYSLAIIFLIYSPVIINDLKTNGQNLHYFKAKFTKTGGRISPPLKTVSQDFLYNAYEYFFIVTGNDQINGIKLTGYGFACKACYENLNIKIIILVLFAYSIFSLIFSFFKEKDPEKKNFLLLVSLWFFITFFLYYSLAGNYRMYPRFFLLISPLAILFVGFIFQYLRPEKNLKRLIFFTLIILFLVIINLQKIFPIFKQLRDVPTGTDFQISMGDVFPQTDRITLAEQLHVVEYIKQKYQENHYPVYLSSKSEYEPVYWYFLERSGIPYYDKINGKKLYAQGNYFDIILSNSRPYLNSDFTIKEQIKLGALNIYYLEPKPANIIGQRQAESDRKIPEETNNISELLKWNEIFKK